MEKRRDTVVGLVVVRVEVLLVRSFCHIVVRIGTEGVGGVTSFYARRIINPYIRRLDIEG